jgi:hypothetical protein
MTLAVNLAQGASNNVTFRNRIINGTFTISQYNGTSSVTPSSDGYIIDRYKVENSQASKLTYQQNAGSVTPPAGFSNYLGATVASTVSIGAGDYFLISQPIEGYNVADLNWGTANAQTVTLSFWVRSSLTGTFGGSLQNSANTRSYPFTYTISSANTWEYETITIAGDISGTWLTTNGIGLKVRFSVGTGSTYSGAAGAWAGTSYLSATGATSIMATASATFYVTGVQLEAGTTASPFEYRQYGTELALCQRYYNMVANYSQTGGVAPITNIVFPSATDIRAIYNFPVQMRVAPSVVSSSGSSYFRIYNGNNIYANSIGLDFASVSGIGIVSGGGTSGATQGQGGIIFANTAGAYFALSAEL